MKSRLAWIVTDDALLGEDVKQRLPNECQLRSISINDWRADKDPGGRPDWTLLDLRAPELWDQVDQVASRTASLKGHAVPSIGIIQEAIPLPFVASADHALAALVPWPDQQDGLAQKMESATAQQRAQARSLDGDRRVLESANYRFVTYTHELFAALDHLQIVARHDFTILIVGETGTGKTTLAQMIHELSERRDERFLSVACGALASDLIDSELFGHVKGAFTGAEQTREGKFDAADRGTLLLDEIDVLGMVPQAKLLRVLETGEFEPVGCNDTHHSNVRAIVASNVSLEELVEKRQFRNDLYYRLNQVKIEIPPLRDRPMDIVPLAMGFIEECCREHQMQVHRVHPDFVRILKLYNWPGNIRELRNEVRRAVLFCRDGFITPLCLSPNLLQAAEEIGGQKPDATPTSELAREVAVTEQEAIEEMLRKHDFNRAATARALGISRVTLYNKIHKYRINLNPK